MALPSYIQDALRTVQSQGTNMFGAMAPKYPAQTEPTQASAVSFSGPQDFQSLLDMYNKSIGAAPVEIPEARIRNTYQSAIDAAMKLGSEQIRSASADRGAAPNSGVEEQQARELGLRVQQPMVEALMANMFSGNQANLSRLGSLFGAASGPQSFSLGYRQGTDRPGGSGGAVVNQAPSTIGTGSNTYSGGYGSGSSYGGSAQQSKGSSGGSGGGTEGPGTFDPNRPGVVPQNYFTSGPMTWNSTPYLSDAEEPGAGMFLGYDNPGVNAWGGEDLYGKGRLPAGNKPYSGPLAAATAKWDSAADPLKAGSYYGSSGTAETQSGQLVNMFGDYVGSVKGGLTPQTPGGLGTADTGLKKFFSNLSI